MSRASSFDVTIKVDRHELHVTGMEQPFFPAKLTGHPDTWAPAEGGELEDVEVKLVRKGRERALPADMVERLELDERIHDALQS